MTPTSIVLRLKQLAGYAALARRPWDAWPLVVLGYARGNQFHGEHLVARMGRRFYPAVRVRPSVFNGLSAEILPTELGQMIIFDEIVRDLNYDLSIVPFVPDKIFDCGGHVGFFSLLATSKWPAVPITVFEPNPQNAARIRRHIEINRLTKVELMEAAVSVKDGSASFQREASFAGHLIDPARSDAGAIYHSVRTVDFPSWFAKQGATRPLLKIDIEGEETAVVPPLLVVLPRTCAVFFETHAGESGYEEIAGAFRGNGFEVRRHRTWENCVDGYAVRN